MEKEFTLSIFTENKIGVLQRITGIFTRRHINIDSMIASESEVKGVYRFTIVVNCSLDLIKKVHKQIEKQIGVLKAFYFTNKEIVYQEIALYKVPTKSFSHGNDVENLIRNHNAHILTVEPDYIIIEKAGHKDETQELFNKLLPYGILQFARSGRVAVSKQIKEITAYLRDLEEASLYSEKELLLNNK
ncbi:MAG: acetolactate synthase small subunit [Bacteroidales bacterium]|nr:acetolactate synthase small subunit [Bacteroidales bacterium]